MLIDNPEKASLLYWEEDYDLLLKYVFVLIAKLGRSCVLVGLVNHIFFCDIVCRLKNLLCISNSIEIWRKLSIYRY
ncbi:hypothetical protein HanRHA438_Chr03g0111251 [Helianthus annuus]|uniref:Uncharacterized protein n=1 Tax=Helianthus annuus TaxID=4232 RepID=A0A9K3NUX2_HELAN|nr:hypothetical protein HanXRQr2_Chr03g0100211 [Helianthus annuus]KAJ0592303.1 hypothetical protein HanHA300_Chr03g0083461 [Helianthus annuus]KAJ0599816.1 hypothetical protein HanIR_Chr03g0109381 [Helianthus annuus]KAJ0607288.1 hypothetical protein HanHA89_Chr03g0094951 [Helianthus annuus]KAJ0767348.1 hypothetical protein HanLR1_Chr03g0088251 [Helianthus annuus]